MKTGGSNFDQIIQEVLNQKQSLEKLRAENQDLHRQITDLLEARGIFVEIQGKRFALMGETILSVTQIPSLTQDSGTLAQAAMSTNTNKIPMPSIPDTPWPDVQQLEQIARLNQMFEEESPALSPTFLEEMLGEEFSSEVTTPMLAWKNTETRKLTSIDEEEKAALRRELTGSFLLE